LLAAAAVAAMAAGGCASAGGSSLFVKRAGSGPIDVGGPPMSEADRDALARAKREALARRAAEPKRPLPSVEGADPALREALAALGRSPSPAAHVAAGLEYERLGILDAAFDHYSDALRLDPEYAAAWDRRARLWRDWHLIALALGDVHRARYFAPRSAEVQNTLGTILERAGDCAEALKAYRRALELAPGAAWAAENIERLDPACGTPEPGTP
jgi:tetratricopeptide (TPR) repeat protein